MGASFARLLASHSNSLKPLQLHHGKPQHPLLHPSPNPSCSLSLLLGPVSGPPCVLNASLWPGPQSQPFPRISLLPTSVPSPFTVSQPAPLKPEDPQAPRRRSGLLKSLPELWVGLLQTRVVRPQQGAACPSGLSLVEAPWPWPRFPALLRVPQTSSHPLIPLTT